jgi:sirohydrochlorin cobaltochelatase
VHERAGAECAAATEVYDVTGDDKTAVILYAHGARDPRWAEPFERLRTRLRALAPGRTILIAFLESRAPDLVTACRAAREQGAERIRVVPIFFGRGGHLREDLPRRLEEVREALEGTEIEVTEPAGENEGVLNALARFALEAQPARE